MKKYFALLLALSMPLAQATRLPKKKWLSASSHGQWALKSAKCGAVTAAALFGFSYGIAAGLTAVVAVSESKPYSKAFLKIWNNDMGDTAKFVGTALTCVVAPVTTIAGAVVGYFETFEYRYNEVIDSLKAINKSYVVKPFESNKEFFAFIAQSFVMSPWPLVDAFDRITLLYNRSSKAYVALEEAAQYSWVGKRNRSQAKELLGMLKKRIEQMNYMLQALQKHPQFNDQRLLKLKKSEVLIGQQMAAHQQEANNIAWANFVASMLGAKKR